MACLRDIFAEDILIRWNEGESRCSHEALFSDLNSTSDNAVSREGGSSKLSKSWVNKVYCHPTVG